MVSFLSNFVLKAKNNCTQFFHTNGFFVLIRPGLNKFPGSMGHCQILNFRKIKINTKSNFLKLFAQTIWRHLLITKSVE